MYYKIKNLSLLLVLIFFVSCKENKYRIEAADVSLINVTEDILPDEKMKHFLAPYKDSLDRILSDTIAFSDYYLPKKIFNDSLGRWFSSMMLDFFKRNYLSDYPEYKNIDIFLFNYGGLRTDLNKGPVKLSFVYDFMPFDNRFALVELKGEAMKKMFDYLNSYYIKGNIHPIDGMELVSKNGKVFEVKIGGKKFDENKTYTILTSDFLLLGGDEMLFLADNESQKISSILIRDAIASAIMTNKKIALPKNSSYVTK